MEAVSKVNVDSEAFQCKCCHMIRLETDDFADSKNRRARGPDDAYAGEIPRAI